MDYTICEITMLQRIICLFDLDSFHWTKDESNNDVFRCEHCLVSLDTSGKVIRNIEFAKKKIIFSRLLILGLTTLGLLLLSIYIK